MELSIVHPFDPRFQASAFEVYKELQESRPVYEFPEDNLVMVTSHELIGPILRDTKTFSSRFGQPGEQYSGSVADRIAQIQADGWPYLPTMLTQDPPVSTRYRKTVASYFTRGQMRQLQPVVEAIMASLINDLPDGEPFDVVPNIAVPLPIRTIAAVLHLPDERLADFKRWSDDAVAGTGAKPSDERMLEAARGVLEMQRYFAEQLEERRREPIGDLLTDLVQATIETDEHDDSGEPVRRPLEMAEMLSILRQLLVAGNETTTNALATGIRLLAENPDEWRKLKADPERVTAVTEEVLRLATPVTSMYRLVTTDTEIGGCPVHKGARVTPMYAAANRDPAVWGPDADALDPDRPSNGHLAFGRGAHFCLGAPLARLELETAFRCLSSRLQTIELTPDNEFEYHPSFLLRGLRSLRIVAQKEPAVTGGTGS